VRSSASARPFSGRPSPTEAARRTGCSFAGAPSGCFYRKDVGPHEVRSDLGPVQMAGHALVALNRHDCVDVHHSVNDLAGAAHLGRGRVRGA